MKKSIVALAVASAFVVPVAMADVTIYGQANLSYDAINNGNTTSAASANNVSSNVSRLGFKGSEDLGDGLSAVWQIERGISFDTTTAGDSVRDTFAGFSSPELGTFLAGVHDTPYKMATRGLDLFADSIADNRSIMGVITGAVPVVGFLGVSTPGYTIASPLTNDARLGNVVAFVSPSYDGLTLISAVVAGAETPVGASSKGGAGSLAALYSDGPVFATLSYQTINIGTTGTGTTGAVTPLLQGGKTTAWKLGGSYAFDDFQVNAVYESTSDKGLLAPNAANAFGHAAWYLGGKYSFGSDAVKLAYTTVGNAGSVANTGAKQVTLGYDHNLSKKTSVYALYTKLSNDTGADYYFSQTTGATTTGVNQKNGAAPSAFSFGFKHAF